MFMNFYVLLPNIKTETGYFGNLPGWNKAEFAFKLSRYKLFWTPLHTMKLYDFALKSFIVSL